MDRPAPKPRRSRLPIYLMITAAVLVFAGANAHLLFAAFSSQPDCIDHLKVGHGQQGAFRAASSAC
jgi:hypothetical protein